MRHPAKSIAAAVALGLFGLPLGAAEMLSYYDHLKCAAIYSARIDYGQSLEQVTQEQLAELHDRIAQHLSLAEGAVPLGQLPCSRRDRRNVLVRTCVRERILEPQFGLLRLEMMLDLVQRAGPAGPLPDCATDPACSACAALIADPTPL